MPAGGAIKSRAGSIRLAVFDVDGVMTDGCILMGEDGTEFKSFHVHDGKGLVMLQEAGIMVAIISSRTSQAVSRRMAELGIKHVYQGMNDKGQILKSLVQELGIDYDTVAYVGDDIVDVPAMKQSGLAIAVANARPEVLACADWTTFSPGGSGAVREVCDLLLQSRGARQD